MIVTPHFHPGRYVVTASQILEGIRLLQRRIDTEEIDIHLYPGQECYYYSGLLEQLDAGNALTMNGTKYVLVEFDTETQYSYINKAILELRMSGYKPIIAHFERYRCLYQRRERLDELRENGAMLQMNFDTLRDGGNIFRPNQWRRLLKKGYVDFLGSDTHGMKFRPLDIKYTMDWLNTDVEPDIKKQIMDSNIQRLK
jgi:protein-tyrosine phosphatase